MSKITPRLERAIEAARRWPSDRQDAAAEVLERIDALEARPFELSAEEMADLEQALEEARRGEFASEQDVAAMFERHGL